MKGTTSTATILIALPILYALSVGPVVAFLEHGRLSPNHEEFLTMLYTPLGWVVETTGMEPYADVYVNWWIKALKRRTP